MKVFSQWTHVKTHVYVVFTGRVKGDCTIERVAFVMNIVPCRGLNLRRKA